MDGKLRNMTSVYLTGEQGILCLYRIGSRVANNKYVGACGGHFVESELSSPESCVLREMQEELGLSPDEIEALFENFGKKGVEIADDADLTPEDLEKDEELQDVDTDVDLSVPEGINIDDPVRMYLKEIGRVPLLTAEEEIHLATDMEAGVRAERRIRADKYIKAYLRNPGKVLTVGKLARKLGVDNSVVATSMLGDDNEMVKALREMHGIKDDPEENDSKSY